ncbi:MAG: Stf0 family sulfotransferase [Thiolinea sp.]
MSYAICAEARSGSTLLCLSLIQLGIAGDPKEYFGGHVLGRPFQKESFEDFIARTLAYSKTSNGVSGIKLFMSHFDAIRRSSPRFGEIKDEQILKKLDLDRIILLQREDVLRQSISLYLASQTQVWLLAKDKNKEGVTRKTATPAYNRRKIHRAMRSITLNYERWQQCLANSKTSYLKVSYEELTTNYELTMKRILDYLDLPIPTAHSFETMPTLKQADELTEHFVRRYQNPSKVDKIFDVLDDFYVSVIRQKLKLTVLKSLELFKLRLDYNPG